MVILNALQDMLKLEEALSLDESLKGNLGPLQDHVNFHENLTLEHIPYY
jgi:hypothetical protein